MSASSVFKARVLRSAGRWVGVLSGALVAAGCSVLQPPPPTVPPPAPVPSEPVKPEPPPVPVAVPTPPPVVSKPRAAVEPEEASPKVEPIPSGAPNAPYVINGERYVPATRDVAMQQVGLASWYGKPFHGRKTANGEIYNMHRMTAAHKTMPLPSYALVRHRDNGREVIVRINDRGPFIKGRVIDLSYAAAKALGIEGLAQVEVIRLTHEAIRTGAWRQELKGSVVAKR
jgi:rare lipoprotein A